MQLPKMYHMVQIPPVDQYVNIFLWKNFETEHEPDTSIKTVLTFGDRPAPAMAIIANRKTAKPNHDTKSKATKAIPNNAYVDDTCNSAVNSHEAKTLISTLTSAMYTA